MRKIVLTAALLLGLLAPVAPGAAAQAPTADSAEDLLEAMTIEERVGQLFLVGMRGSAPDPALLELVRRGRISGVVLRAEHDNFAAGPDTLLALQALIDQLQAARLADTVSAATPQPASEAGRSVYVPLFIGLALNREGSADPEIVHGLSEPVSNMALGATWDAELAEAVGAQVARELAAVGVNLVLGPSLDVIDEAAYGSPGDLGTESFGGDPFWVSRMGEAYVRGLHQGSEGWLAVIAKHFPGTGASDRPPSEEVATVRKSLEGLRLVDLAPFFAVTQTAPGESPSTIDGVLLSHIRYQGLQGNIRQTTRPVSLDRLALAQILGLESLPEWRLGGGVVLSDSLGSRAVRRFYDPAEQAFNGPLVAHEAFQAGSDLLLLEDFVSSGDPDEITTIRRTLDAFSTRYRDDAVFAERVDAAVLRVLRLKLRLYDGRFTEQSATRRGGVEALTPSSTLASLVARRAASWISPMEGLNPDLLGVVPTTGQRVVVFTDVRSLRQCSGCPSEPVIDPGALESTMTDLYGPRAGGQARVWNLTSFSLADLAFSLGERPPSGSALGLADPAEVEAALEAAHWVVFNLLSGSENRYGADALKILLDRHPELLQGKQVVAFAFDVPYRLGATDLSKVDLLYALYSPSPSFVNTAARLLYQEMAPEGDPPVSVAGVGYDLIEALSPDPDQTIGLRLRPQAGTVEGTPPVSGFSAGDTVILHTLVILDHNGRVVADGTPVEFQITYPGETLAAISPATTVGGVAEAAIRLDRTGLTSIRVVSEPARTSEIVQLDVREGVPAFATVIAPSPVPSATAPSTQAAVSPTPAGQAESSGNVDGAGRLGLPSGGWLVAVLTAALLGAGGFVWSRRQGVADRDSLRVGLLIAAGCLLGFDYLALGLPGSGAFLAESPYLALVVFSGLGGAAGLAAAEMWRRRDWAV